MKEINISCRSKSLKQGLKSHLFHIHTRWHSTPVWHLWNLAGSLVPLMWPKARVWSEQKSLPRRVRDYDSRSEGDWGASQGGICVGRDYFQVGVEFWKALEHYRIEIFLFIPGLGDLLATAAIVNLKHNHRLSHNHRHIITYYSTQKEAWS